MRQLAPIFAILLLAACSDVDPVPPPDAEHDLRLVGTWVGTSPGQDGMVRSWRQIRRGDGTYEITFESHKDGALVRTSHEQGYWWTRADLFFEHDPLRMRQPDVYRVEWRSSVSPRFTQISRDETGTEAPGYAFEESRSDP